jgi:aspartyl-tRNA(Asn)/glutamyl-tRNA(Gln) amidotransferase subunit A
MSFREWAELGRRDPAAAARAVRRSIEQLSPEAARATWSWTTPEPALHALFAAQTAAGGPLAGVPFAVKDLFPVRGVPLRAGASFLPEVRPEPARDSALVAALLRAGAVLAGTTHLHEFAYGLTGENRHWGNVTHPLDASRTSGGSSSGSAAAVAAGAVPLALGTDTGGSIRVPAAYCGLFGFRMTPHHPWISDAFPLASSFDTPGWFTQTPSDMQVVLAALLGLGASTRPLRGLWLSPKGWIAVENDVADALDAAARRWAEPADDAARRDLIAGFTGSSLAYSVLQSREAWTVHAGWLDARRAQYSPEVWERIDRGRRWTSEQMDDAHRKQAVVRLLWTRFFLTYDFLILPATPFRALRTNELTVENRQRLLELTAPASLGGLPVLTVPVPLPDGITTGLQIVVNTVSSPVLPWVLSTA